MLIDVEIFPHRCTVTTTSGTFTAKHAIVTFSPGVLTSRRVTFEPELPDWKVEALSYVPMGDYCRFFFR